MARQFCNGRRDDRADLHEKSRGTWVAPAGVVPKKQQIRVSPERSGRRVRWTFEVSADVDAEKRPRAKKPAKKRKGATASAKPARKSSRPHAQAAPARTRTPTPAEPVAPPVPTSPPAVESTPPADAAPVIQATLPWHTTGRQLGTLAGIAVVVIATMAVPQWPPASDSSRSRQQETEQRASVADVSYSAPIMNAPARRLPAIATSPILETPRRTEEAKTKPPVVNATNRKAASTRPAPAASVSTNTLVPRANESTTEPLVPKPMPAAAASPASGVSLPPVTITGCLEISTDGNDYRLADTEGADAPKSRSWRTGFLRKRTAPVALIDAPDPHALKSSIGKRVAATGVLSSRELQVSSLRVVAPSCG